MRSSVFGTYMYYRTSETGTERTREEESERERERQRGGGIIGARERGFSVTCEYVTQITFQWTHCRHCGISEMHGVGGAVQEAKLKRPKE